MSARSSSATIMSEPANRFQGWASAILASSLFGCGVQVHETTRDKAPIAASTSTQARIRRVGSMGTPRAVHTATLLATGDVLVAGGMVEGGRALRSLELYDAGSDRCVPVGDMLEARSGHSATLLSDGRVLLAGGYDGSYLSSVELYDPHERTTTAAKPLNEARSGHTATSLADGNILFSGGVGVGWSFLSSVETYDVAGGTFEVTAPMNESRESHTATLLADGTVLIIGGHRGRRESIHIYQTSERYEPDARRFRPSGSLLTPRRKHDALRLADGRVLVIGGANERDEPYDTSEIYDPIRESFAAGPRLSIGRSKLRDTAILLPHDRVLVAGGAERAEMLEVATGRTHALDEMLDGRLSFPTATLLADGSVLILGGYDERIRNSAGIWRYR